eukprot:m51a1_g6563 hypothetical protein (721) ;mRNA; r:135621-139300
MGKALSMASVIRLGGRKREETDIVFDLASPVAPAPRPPSAAAPGAPAASPRAPVHPQGPAAGRRVAVGPGAAGEQALRMQELSRRSVWVAPRAALVAARLPAPAQPPHTAHRMQAAAAQAQAAAQALPALPSLRGAHEAGGCAAANANAKGAQHRGPSELRATPQALLQRPQQGRAEPQPLQRRTAASTASAPREERRASSGAARPLRPLESAPQAANCAAGTAELAEQPLPARHTPPALAQHALQAAGMKRAPGAPASPAQQPKPQINCPPRREDAEATTASSAARSGQAPSPEAPQQHEQAEQKEARVNCVSARDVEIQRVAVKACARLVQRYTAKLHDAEALLAAECLKLREIAAEEPPVDDEDEEEQRADDAAARIHSASGPASCGTITVQAPVFSRDVHDAVECALSPHVPLATASSASGGVHLLTYAGAAAGLVLQGSLEQRQLRHTGLVHSLCWGLESGQCVVGLDCGPDSTPKIAIIRASEKATDVSVRFVERRPQGPGILTGAYFVPNTGDKRVLSVGSEVVVWNTEEKKSQTTVFPSHSSLMTSCHVGHAGDFAFIGSEDGALHSFSLDTGAHSPVAQLAAPVSHVAGVAASPDVLVVSTFDGSRSLLSLVDRRCQRPTTTCPIGSGGPCKPSVHSNGALVACACPGEPEPVALWDLRALGSSGSQSRVQSLALHGGKARVVSFHPSEPCMLTCGTDGTLAAHAFALSCA